MSDSFWILNWPNICNFYWPISSFTDQERLTFIFATLGKLQKISRTLAYYWILSEVENIDCFYFFFIDWSCALQFAQFSRKKLLVEREREMCSRCVIVQVKDGRDNRRLSGVNRWLWTLITLRSTSSLCKLSLSVFSLVNLHDVIATKCSYTSPTYVSWS